MLIQFDDTRCVGRRILLLRKHYGLSRRALAKLIGMEEKRLKLLEEGQAVPILSYSALARLCQVFDTRCEDLFPSRLPPPPPLAAKE